MAGDEAMHSTLSVDFCGDTRVVNPGEQLTFGRQADLVIDDNRFLHRVVGRFHFHTGSWWIDNIGSQISIVVADRATTSHLRLAPQSTSSLTFRDSVAQFSAAQARYEIDLHQTGGSWTVGAHQNSFDGTETVKAGDLRFNQEQRLLLVALALPHLREPHLADLSLPTNREVAARLGWEITKFNRKLDYICHTMNERGFRGLVGGQGNMASNRRVLLVRYVIDSGLITHDDIPSDW